MEAYGSSVLANPDFVQRLQRGADFDVPDSSTSFGDDGRGYIDYPALA